jgi:hypothetical protein
MPIYLNYSTLLNKKLHLSSFRGFIQAFGLNFCIYLVLEGCKVEVKNFGFLKYLYAFEVF